MSFFSIYLIKFELISCHADIWDKGCWYYWCWSILHWGYKVWKFHRSSSRPSFWLLGTVGGAKQKENFFRNFFNYNVIIAYWISFMKFLQSVFDFQLINNLLSMLDFRYAVSSRNLGFILCFLCKFCLIYFQLVRPGWK